MIDRCIFLPRWEQDSKQASVALSRSRKSYLCYIWCWRRALTSESRTSWSVLRSLMVLVRHDLPFFQLVLQWVHFFPQERQRPGFQQNIHRCCSKNHDYSKSLECKRWQHMIYENVISMKTFRWLNVLEVAYAIPENIAINLNIHSTPRFWATTPDMSGHITLKAPSGNKKAPMRAPRSWTK